MKRALRYLRIGWSVFFGVLCLLLIVLWVRSYWWVDAMYGHLGVGGVNSFVVESAEAQTTIYVGLLSIRHVDGWPWGGDSEWGLLDESVLNICDRHFCELRREAAIPNFSVYHSRWGHGAITIPNWYPVATCITLTAFPWVRWSRRFSLRTLLIAITLVALALGLYVSLR